MNLRSASFGNFKTAPAFAWAFACWLLGTCHLVAGPEMAAGGEDVATVVERSPIRGGLCVVVGDLDAQQTIAVANSGAYLVHVLSRQDERAITATRVALHEAGYAGRATVERWVERHLPYMDGLVSLLVAAAPDRVEPGELKRVVRPLGEIVERTEGEWRRTVKPKPQDVDEWSQWRHGADRNPVSKDRRVDVPRRTQWLFSSSVALEAADMVTADGRVFIQDRDWLLARDAFNGLPLWRVRLYPAKKLELDKFGFKKPPALIAARGARVFALLEDGVFRALDAATGRPASEFPEAGLPTTVMLLDDGKLVLAGDDGVRAYEASSGRRLWYQAAELPHTLVAGGGAVYYVVGSDRTAARENEVVGAELAARDASTGRLLWKKTHAWADRTELASYGEQRIVFEVRNPLDWRERWGKNPERQKAEKFQLAVVDARTGEELQRLFGVGSSARHGEFCTAFWKDGRLLTEARTPAGIGIATYAADDLQKPLEVFRANFVGDRGWGHCYPPVLTERFYINGQLHFTNLESRTQSGNVITRGACHVLRPGYIPANGMIYTFPKHCVCFPMLNGNICLAGDSESTPEESHPRIEGPAYGQVEPTPIGPTDWPTFRHDEFRTAGTESPAPAALDVIWSESLEGIDYRSERGAEWSDNPWLAGPVTAPVVVGDTVLVAQSDAQRVIAFDAAGGRRRWQFFAGGRIDGPPTVHAGLAIFGCRDGWVYALRLRDGELAWRWRAAPDDRRISLYGQLESAWPCAGSVLASDGLVYVSAGLHPNSDGGVRVACLNPTTGTPVWTGKFDDLGMESEWPAPHDPRPKDKSNLASDPWRTIRPQEYRHFDLPVRDGDKIAVSRCTFDPRTGEVELRKTSGYYEVRPGGAKLPRTSWKYNDVQAQSPLAVARGGSVFSTTPRKGFLFRADFPPGGRFDADWVNVPHEQWKAGVTHAASKIYERGVRWAVETGSERAAYPRAMAVAGDRLAYAHPDGRLIVYDVQDGRERLTRKLEPLAWDGLAAAGGRFYATTAGGKVLCLGSR